MFNDFDFSTSTVLFDADEFGPPYVENTEEIIINERRSEVELHFPKSSLTCRYGDPWIPELFYSNATFFSQIGLPDWAKQAEVTFGSSTMVDGCGECLAETRKCSECLIETCNHRNHFTKKYCFTPRCGIDDHFNDPENKHYHAFIRIRNSGPNGGLSHHHLNRLSSLLKRTELFATFGGGYEYFIIQLGNLSKLHYS